MQHIAKAIAAFLTPLFLTFLAYLGVPGDMTVETAVPAILYGLIIAGGTAVSVYITPNDN